MEQPTSFRLDDTTHKMIDQLADALGLSRVDVVRLAVRKLHRAEGLAEPAATALAPRRAPKGGK